jgi:hypothetical protein
MEKDLIKLNKLTSEVYNKMQTGDGSHDSQDRINEAILASLEEIYRILKNED